MFEQYNFEKTKKHMEAFWNKDYHERCNLAITVPNVNNAYKSRYDGVDVSTKDTYMNVDYVYERCLAATRNNVYLAEGFPVFYSNFGTAGHCTYFGCESNYSRDTVWFETAIDEPDASLLKFDIDNCPSFEEQLNFMKEISRRSKGEFMVGMNDNCGIVDALAEIRGTDLLLMDMITDEDFVSEAVKKVTAAWIATQPHFFNAIKDNNDGGSTHGWMKTWHPGSHAQIQCDFSVMISPDFFEQFVLPELIETSAALDATSYHLDGQEQLRHLDFILSVKTIDNIQWTAVAGQPPTSHFIESLQKIQSAGKGLILGPNVEEVPFLLENLSHKGLHINLPEMESVEQANEIIALATKLAH